MLTIPATGCDDTYGTRTSDGSTAAVAEDVYTDNGVYETDSPGVITGYDITNYDLYVDSTDSLSLYVDTRIATSTDAACSDIDTDLFTEVYDDSNELNITEEIFTWIILIISIVVIILTIYFFCIREK